MTLIPSKNNFHDNFITYINMSFILDHLKHRSKHLCAIEEKQLRILEQCGKCVNNLEANFRYDIVCQAFDKFKALGLNLKILFQFQKYVHAIYPWNCEYDMFRFGVNRVFNVFPLIIVLTKSEEDVIQAFRFARKYNITISLRGGAHSFEGFSLTSGMIIDQSQRTCIKVCTDTVRCEPGVLLGPLVEKLFAQHRTLPIGSCPNNAVTGYCYGGGMGLLTRIFGTGSDNIVQAKILLANGNIVIASETCHPDLFFALRGAGIGNYGIVLSTQFKTHPINKVWIFNLAFTLQQIKPVLTAWTPWITTNPLTISSDFIVTQTECHIDGVYLGHSKEELEALLAPFTALNPIKTEMQYVPYIEAVKIAAGKGRWLPFFKFKNAFLDKSNFDASKAADVITEFMLKATPIDYIIISQLGGVNDIIPPTSTAFVHRNKLAWVHINAQWEDQYQAASKYDWITSFYEHLLPYLDYQVYQNTPDLDIVDYLPRYYGENLPKLVDIKRKYDPENVFHYAQSIPVSL